MNKLFAVTYEIRLLVLAEDEHDAYDIARSRLTRGDCDGEIAQAVPHAMEVASIAQLDPDERGSLPWDRRSYNREEGEDVTCEQILQRQAKPEGGP